ncbi:hypothetical protein JCGZ_17830 [Jatropha curcas]|uniref:mitogen-activated protein kinase kinase n=1 Tax=Jatropha curcas TaxID=180498 RepID=A0A067JS01_JATCU|nr:mitogen-activated protein kinase kinase 9 [Jatropha curcas]KDP26672.1 hypothetical protein JCGZ_17830 [Jatropha curcas]
MVLVRQKLQRNSLLSLPELKICDSSPFPNPNPNHNPSSVSNIITHQAVVTDFSDLEKLWVIGHGNHGIVYKVRQRSTSAIYALKMVQQEDTNAVSHETEILTCTDSPFTIKCYGIFEPRAGEKAILMEYMDGGTLDTALSSNGPFPEALLVDVAKQVLNGLNYLHAHNIVHLDIKPSNLLISNGMKVKIGDFGVSRIVNDNDTRNYENLGSRGTYAYMSPERLDSQTFGSGYVYAGDVWSLGVSLWELYVGHFPFFEDARTTRPSWMELVMVICYGEFPCLPNKASQEFGSFLKCCLEREPSKRWNVSQLLSHPFIGMEREAISWCV